MNIQELAAELVKHGNNAAIVEAAKGSAKPLASKAEYEAGIDALNTCLEKNRHQEAVATMLALLLWDADGAIARIRRRGMLRASRYKFHAKCAVKVVEAALSLGPVLNMRSDRLRYLESILVVLSMATEARRLRENLLSRIRSRQSLVLKTLLFLVNELFANNWMGDRNQDSTRPEHWSAEDFALGYSYLLHLATEEIGVVPAMWTRMDERLVNSTETFYLDLLMDAARLNELQDVETLIDGLPYQATLDKGMVTVCSVDPDFEKSIRLGYIQSETQVAIRAAKATASFPPGESEFPTLRGLIQKAFKAGIGKFVHLRTNPIERLVLELPLIPKLFAFLATDQLFADEISVLLGAGIENFRPEEAATLRVSENLVALDIIKIQRFFGFVDALFAESLRSIDDAQRRNTLRLRSVIPVIRHEVLVHMLCNILPAAKAEEAVLLLSLQENQKYVDIQYRPFIKMGQQYILSTALVSRSNLIRNIVTANNLRPKLVDKIDPMETAVVNALIEVGFKVKRQFNFNIDGKRETDILCWRDGELFVFECKNSFHPCSSHELRTSFEHLKIAEDQLDIRLAWLKTAENQKKLLKWLGWDVPVTQKIHTGIVTANRLFTGYRMGSHPVRQAHELINVLLRGEIVRPEGPPLRFWRESMFQVADFVDYLLGESIVRMQFDLLQPLHRSIQVGNMKLVLQNYFMDVLAANEQIEAKLAEVSAGAGS